MIITNPTYSEGDFGWVKKTKKIFVTLDDTLVEIFCPKAHRPISVASDQQTIRLYQVGGLIIQ